MYRGHGAISLVIVCIFLTGISVLGVVVHDCGSKIGSASSVSVTGCDDKSPVCLLTKGSNVTIDIRFKTKKSVSSVTARVHGIVAGVPVPWPVPHPDACDDILKCPLQPSTSYDYKNTIDVKSSYPAISLTIKWELQNEDNQDIVCIELHARLKSSDVRESNETHYSVIHI